MEKESTEPKLFIERLTPDDLTGLIEIERACYIDPWNPDMFDKELSGRAYDCPLGGRLIHDSVPGSREGSPGVQPSKAPLLGFAIAHLLTVETHILNLAVDPQFQGRGYGRAILYALLNYAAEQGERRAILEVRESNKIAQRLYLSAGFRVIGQRRNYYEKQKEDALVMLLDPLRPVFPRCYVLAGDLTAGAPGKKGPKPGE
jgi:ribosomal-protein-alanine N-acetyltransferase